MLWGFLAVLVLSLMARFARAEAKVCNGRQVLEYGLPVRLLGLVMLVLVVALVHVIFTTPVDDRMRTWPFAVCMIIAAMAIFLEFFFVRISFDEQVICTRSPWRVARRIPWSDVDEIGFSSLNQWHLVRTPSNGVLRLSVLLSGLGSFFSELRVRTPLQPVMESGRR